MLFGRGLSLVPKRPSSFLSRTRCHQQVRDNPVIACVVMLAIIIHTMFVTAAAMMSAIYEEYKDEDGFLYMTYSSENTFGSL